MKKRDITSLNDKIQSTMQAEDWLGAIEIAQSHMELVESNWKLSWNLGWSFFKLDRFKEARKHLLRATRLSPHNAVCLWAAGVVYSELKNYKRAEANLIRSLSIQDTHIARITLALTYLKQGKVDKAEQVHLDGLKLKPKDSRRYKSYSAFLYDVARDEEARQMYRKGRNLRRQELRKRSKLAPV